MTEGPRAKTKDYRTMRNGQTLPITLANGDVIEIEHHGDRSRWGIRVPAGVVVGTPEIRDARNSDDQGE